MIFLHQTSTGPEVGKLAPNLVFLRSNGGRVRLSDFRGRVVIVEFTSFACPPCRELAPKYRQLAAGYRGKNIIFLVVSTDPPANLANLAAERKAGDPTLLLQDAYALDRSRSAARQLGSVGSPTMFVINEAGRFGSRAIQDGIPHLRQRLDWVFRRRLGPLGVQ
jgi:thiol-disulfide isomerase/thioredoxin